MTQTRDRIVILELRRSPRGETITPNKEVLIQKNVESLARDPHEKFFNKAADNLLLLNQTYGDSQESQIELRKSLEICGVENISELYEKIRNGIEILITMYINTAIPSFFVGTRAHFQDPLYPITNPKKQQLAEINLFRFGILPIEESKQTKLFDEIIHEGTLEHKTILGVDHQDKITKNSIIDYVKKTVAKTLKEVFHVDQCTWSEELIQKIIQSYIALPSDTTKTTIDEIVAIQKLLSQFNTSAQASFYGGRSSESDARNISHSVVTISANFSESIASCAENELSDQIEKRKISMMATRDHQNGLLNGLGFESSVSVELQNIIKQVQSGQVESSKLDCIGVISADTAALKSVNDLLGDIAGNGLLSFTTDCLLWLSQRPVTIEGVKVKFKHGAAIGGDEFRMYYEASEPINPEIISLHVTYLLQKLYLYAKEMCTTQVVPSNEQILTRLRHSSIGPEANNDSKSETMRRAPPYYVRPYDLWHNILFYIPFTDGAGAFIEFCGGENSQGWKSAHNKAESAGIPDLSQKLDEIKQAYHNPVGSKPVDTTCVDTREITGVSIEKIVDVNHGFSFFNAVGACAFGEVLNQLDTSALKNTKENIINTILEKMNINADHRANILKGHLKKQLKEKSLLLKLLYSFRVEENKTSSEMINDLLTRLNEFSEQYIDSTNIESASMLLKEYRIKENQILTKARGELMYGSGILRQRPNSFVSLLPKTNITEAATTKRKALEHIEAQFKLLEDKIVRYQSQVEV